MDRYSVIIGAKLTTFTLGAASYQRNVIIEVPKGTSEQQILIMALDKIGTYPKSYTHKITKLS